MGDERLRLLVCAKYFPEVEAAVSARAWSDVLVEAFPLDCEADDRSIEACAAHAAAAGHGVLAIGGHCVRSRRAALTKMGADTLTLGQCHYLLTNESLVDDLLAQGAHLLAPGDLEHWREHLEAQGFERQAARAFYGESTTRLVLLDTGRVSSIDERLAQLTDYVSVPSEKLSVGLDVVELRVARAVQRWRMAGLERRREKVLATTRRHNADLRMVSEILASAADLKSEPDIGNRFQELFTMLFAPERLLYLPIRDGQPQQPQVTEGGVRRAVSPEDEDALRSLGAPMATTELTADGCGFRLHLAHRGEVVAQLEAASVAFPEHLDRYVPLAATLGKAWAMALTNARTFSALERAQLEIARSRERYRALFEQASDSIVLVDPTDGTILEFNDRAPATLGYTRDEFSALGLGGIEAVEDAEKIALHVRRIVDQGSDTFETHHRAKDGTVRDVLVKSKLIQIGQQRYILSLWDDITARKEVERALRHANEAALSANEAKSRFLATMSHEMRTPLNAIIGLSGVLSETELDEPQRQYARVLETASQSLLGLVTDVLDFSRIEAGGGVTLSLAELDPERLVHETVEVLSHEAARKGIELVCDVAGDVPRALRGDGTRLRQIVMNFVSNAVKFTDEGEVVVEVNVAGIDANRVELRIAVSDTGIGLAPELHERIFEPFTQADTSSHRRHGGTGLGLAISKRLVDAMGGDIGVTSELGRGATFWLRVELERASDKTTQRRAPQEVSSARILVADGHAASHHVLTSLLGEWGCAHDSAANAGSALEALRDAATGTPYDVVLIDDQLPSGGDTERPLAQRLQDDPEVAGVTLVHLVRSTHPEHGAPGPRAGSGATIRKPISRASLLQCLAAVRGAPAAIDRAADERVPLARSRVLMAEDNPVNQQVIALQLAKLGQSVDTVADGQRAIEAAASLSYDLVLMDCQMPLVDGYEATRQIRRGEPSGRHVPIVALTAGATTGDRERCHAAGMDDYLSKPITTKALHRTLRRWLALEPQRPPSADASPQTEEKPVHLDNLRELTRADPSQLTQLVDLFLQQCADRVAAMRSALGAGEAQQISAQAHALKGASGTFGAPRLAELAATVEAHANEGDHAVLCSDLDALAGELQRVEEHLVACG